ncbi:MAG: 50S ribosomal protein L17 [Verrucomicrobia bacterium]|jgi:large subunit ribosomal protein L17|nr:50S ribosomal protein L17 [Verrucomicrobiota bacterium]
MRHSKRKHKLGVSGPHRSAMMGNLAVALIQHGRIETTLSKARALRPFIEKIITLAKKAEKANDAARKLHFRRLAISRVRDKQAVARLFDELVTEFTERNGGYTRIYKLGQRIGDAAEMALIELVDGNDEGYNKKPKKKAAKKKSAKKAAKKAVAAEPADKAEANDAEASDAEAVEAPRADAAEATPEPEATEEAKPEASEGEAEEAKKKDA